TPTPAPVPGRTRGAGEPGGPLRGGTAHEPWTQRELPCHDRRTWNLFYPVTGTRNALERAKAVCGPCPVRDACLTHALTHDERYGVWGGLDTDERDALTDEELTTLGLDPAAIRGGEDEEGAA